MPRKTNLVVVNQAVLDDLLTFVSKDHYEKWHKAIYLFPEELERKAGERIIAALHPKKDKEHPDRVKTDWGTKTSLGLFRSIAADLAEPEVEYKP